MNGINNVKYLSQRDPQWASVLLNGSDLTIGDYGCTVTCISMLSDYYGCKMTPDQIGKNPNFVRLGNVVWTGLDFPTFSFRYGDGNAINSNKSVIDNAGLNSYLSDVNNGDRSAIIQITVTPPKGGSSYTHFLVGLWALPDTNDIMVIDPWDGKSKPLFLSYPYAKITEACYFTKWDKTKHNGKQAWQMGLGEPVAPLFN
jgi:hypothetical protein